MTPTSLAGLVAAVLAAAVWLRLWWAKRQTAAQRARAERAEAERDREAGRAATAEATLTVTVAREADKQAGRVLAGEIDAPTTGSPADRIRAVDDRVREIARREGADAGGGDAPAVRRRPATDPARRRAGD